MASARIPRRSGLAAAIRGRRRRRRLSMAVLGALLLGRGAALIAADPVATDLAFERYEVVTGEASQGQTVVPGFFLGGATAELAVVRVDDGGGRRVRMYGFDGAAWVSVLDATLRPGVSFVDVADIGGRDCLITYERGRLSRFDPESASERTLVEIAASYRATDRRGVPHVDVTRDLNGDGRDDLVVPDVDGFWIATQSGDGSFSEVVKLGPPEPFAGHRVGHLDLDESGLGKTATYGDVGITAATIPLYLSRVHQIDYNRDGRIDLAFWNEDHFEVHLQDERGRFDPVARSFTVDVPLDSDGVHTRAIDYTDVGVFSVLFGLGEKTERTMLHSFRDLDGDGVDDLVTLTLAGRSPMKQRSVYAVHFGSSTPGGTVFASDASTTIRPRGKAGAAQPWGYASQWFEDLDGDGQVDVLFRDVKFGFGGMARALVGNSVPINLELYRMEDGLYPDKPATRRKIRRFAPFAGLGNVFFPPVVVGDVNGDGRADLLVGRSPSVLHVFLGVPGPELLARQPRKVAVALPADEGKTRLVDLNKDGKQDLLIHHTPTDRAPSEPHRLTILIARWDSAGR